MAFLLALVWAGPDFLDADSPPRSGAGLVQALAPLLGQPFRFDGAQDDKGRWVTFSRPDQVSPRPGFNCSGFAVAAARVLLDRPFSLGEASRDRRGDSGPGSPLGQDWDFGLDLIANLTEGRALRVFPEETDLEAPAREPLGPGRSMGWGVNLHSRDFEDILAQIKPGCFAFFSLSRPDGRFPAGVAYHHVGLIVPEPPHLWLYHSLTGRGTHRINLADPGQLARFRSHYPPLVRGERRIFMIEAAPPGL